jgi:RNA ligase (TIGR02306 family)
VSTHEAVVFEIKKRAHPNADKLALVDVNGYTCGVRKEDFRDGDLAVFIEPDTCVPVADERFAFLAGAQFTTGEYAGHARIRVQRFRGVYSQGLVVKAPSGASVGDNVFEALNLKHYDPELAGERMKVDMDSAGQEGFGSKYDIEHLVKHAPLMEGKLVLITEKIHGTNMRVGKVNGEIMVGKRSSWVKRGSNIYWRAYENGRDKLEPLAEQGYTIFGEAVPAQSKFHYGPEGGPPRMLVFDVRDPDGRFLAGHEYVNFCARHGLEAANIMACGERFDLDMVKAIAEESASHYDNVPALEGVVVRPWDEEEMVPPIGRLILKYVTNKYLELK